MYDRRMTCTIFRSFVSSLLWHLDSSSCCHGTVFAVSPLLISLTANFDVKPVLFAEKGKKKKIKKELNQFSAKRTQIKSPKNCQTLLMKNCEIQEKKKNNYFFLRHPFILFFLISFFLFSFFLSFFVVVKKIEREWSGARKTIFTNNEIKSFSFWRRPFREKAVCVSLWLTGPTRQTAIAWPNVSMKTSAFKWDLNSPQTRSIRLPNEHRQIKSGHKLRPIKVGPQEMELTVMIEKFLLLSLTLDRTLSLSLSHTNALFISSTFYLFSTLSFPPGRNNKERKVEAKKLLTLLTIEKRRK